MSKLFGKKSNESVNGMAKKLSETSQNKIRARMAVLMTIYLKLTRASNKEEIIQTYSEGAKMLSAEFGPSNGLSQTMLQLKNVPSSMSFNEIAQVRDKVANKLASEAEFLKTALGE